MTDVCPGSVEEPVEVKQSLLTSENRDEDEAETDTDDGAVGEDGENDGRLIIIITKPLFWLRL